MCRRNGAFRGHAAGDAKALRLCWLRRGLIGLSGLYEFYPFDVRQSINAFGTYAEPLSTQPVNLVTRDAPPMPLCHGVRDTNVGDYHTVRFAQKLRETWLRWSSATTPS